MCDNSYMVYRIIIIVVYASLIVHIKFLWYNVIIIYAGKFRKLDVLISTEGDVIFSLELPTEYFQPIHLFLKYTNEDDPNESYNRTTEIGFLNTKSVQYLEYSSQVFYERFQIKAALVSGYREVLGPLYAVPGVYGITTINNVCCSSIKITP